MCFSFWRSKKDIFFWNCWIHFLKSTIRKSLFSPRKIGLLFKLRNVLRDDFCLIWISLGRLSTSKIIFFYILYFWLFGSENLSRDLSILKRFSSKNNKWKISFFLLREKKRKGKWMWMTDIGAKINVFLYFIRVSRVQDEGFRGSVYCRLYGEIDLLISEVLFKIVNTFCLNQRNS